MNFTQLNELLKSQKKKISLTEDIILDEGEEDIFEKGIEINAIESIDGNGHTIDAGGKARIFNIISHKDMTLENIVLKNACCDDGGAILNESRLYMKKCELLDNFSRNTGGAILNNAFLSLQDCRFSNNRSKGSGSAVFNSRNSHFKCESSIFSSNPSKISAGVIYGEENVNLSIQLSDFHDEEKKIIICHEDCELDWSMNDVYENGLAISGSFIDTSVYYGLDFQTLKKLIDECGDEIQLQNDFILADDERELFREGIEIARENIIIDGNGHSIRAYNVPICFKDKNDNLLRIFKVSANNVTFKNIQFAFVKSENGGAIYNSSDSIHIEGCEFLHCNAGSSGGAIYSLNGALDIRNCIFKHCYSQDYGGAIYTENGTIKMSDCEFMSNSSNGNGGVTYSECGKLLVKNSGFTSNKSPRGGVFSCAEGNFENCIFESNYSKFGGAVISDWLHDHSFEGFTFKGCEFCDNYVDYELAYSSFDVGKIHFENCKISSELFESEYVMNKTLKKVMK